MTYKEQILQLRSEGKTYDEICEITGAAKSTVSYYCGEEQPEKSLARARGYRKQIDNYRKYIKEATPCADCGNFFPYYVMHFDHLPGFVKLFNIASYKDYTQDLDVVKREISKCDIVCSNCHAVRTHYRRVAESANGDDYYEDELD